MNLQTTVATTLSNTELADWIAGWISRELKINRDQIQGDQTFVRYGMDSVHAMMMVGDLEERLARRLSPTLAWDFPTVNAMSDFLAKEVPVSAPAAVKVMAAGASASGAPASQDADILAHLDELSEEEIDRLLKERLDPALQ